MLRRPLRLLPVVVWLAVGVAIQPATTFAQIDPRTALAETAGPDGPPRDTCWSGGPAKLASDSNSDRTGSRRRTDETR